MADGTAVAAGARLMRLSGPAAPILSGERARAQPAPAPVGHRDGHAPLRGRGGRDRRVGLRHAQDDARAARCSRSTPSGSAAGAITARACSTPSSIKDNHVAAAGGVAAALRSVALAPRRATSSCEVEVDSLAAARRGARRAARGPCCSTTCRRRRRRRRWRSFAGGRAATPIWIESSGGITLQNIRAYAEAGVDTISVGALTHSAPSVDIALDFES